MGSNSQDETVQKEDHDAQNIEDDDEQVHIPSSSLQETPKATTSLFKNKKVGKFGLPNGDNKELEMKQMFHPDNG